MVKPGSVRRSPYAWHRDSIEVICIHTVEGRSDRPCLQAASPKAYPSSHFSEQCEFAPTQPKVKFIIHSVTLSSFMPNSPLHEDPLPDTAAQ